MAHLPLGDAMCMSSVQEVSPPQQFKRPSRVGSALALLQQAVSYPLRLTCPGYRKLEPDDQDQFRRDTEGGIPPHLWLHLKLLAVPQQLPLRILS